jgi:outer membrane receptor protein involved in Fe transport
MNVQDASGLRDVAAPVRQAGVTFEPRKSVSGSLRVRHFGPRPLLEDGSVNSKSTTIWNGEAGYRLSNRARLVVEAFNIFDANVLDIDYFYASRLPGAPAGGVEDTHTHPAPPRSARIGIQFSFGDPESLPAATRVTQRSTSAAKCWSSQHSAS